MSGNIVDEDTKRKIEKASEEALEKIGKDKPSNIRVNVEGDLNIIDPEKEKYKIEIDYLKKMIAEKDEEIEFLKELLNKKG